MRGAKRFHYDNDPTPKPKTQLKAKYGILHLLWCIWPFFPYLAKQASSGQINRVSSGNKETHPIGQTYGLQATSALLQDTIFPYCTTFTCYAPASFPKQYAISVDAVPTFHNSDVSKRRPIGSGISKGDKCAIT